MKSNGFARPDEARNEESFIDKVHTGHLRTGPGASPRVSYHGQRGERADGYGRQGLCQQGQPTPLRGHYAIVTGSYANSRPSSTPACFGKTRGQAELKTPFEGLSNALECLCHDDAPPDSSGWIKQNAQLAMPAIGQNLRGTAPQPANTYNRMTRPPKPLCPLFARCKVQRIGQNGQIKASAEHHALTQRSFEDSVPQNHSEEKQKLLS